jgi:hypothetical protein
MKLFFICISKYAILSKQHCYYFLERWPSGRRRTPGTRVGVTASRVRIPISPPYKIKVYGRARWGGSGAL